MNHPIEQQSNSNSQPLTSSDTTEEGSKFKSKSKSKPHPPKQRSRSCVIANYLFLCTLVTCLTILCKGGTRLWTISSHSSSMSTDADTGTSITKVSSSLSTSSERGEINTKELYFLLGHYLAVVISFFIVQNSNPGYITHDVMTRVCNRDGLNLLGQESQDEECCSTCVDDDETKSLYNNDQEEVSTKEIEMTSLLINNSTNTNNNKKNKNEMIRRTHNQTNNNNDTNTSKKQPKNQQKRRKVCTICNIAPPLRSHHCKICNKCVATFDHHCGFVGTCIGERNHCRFYWFLFIQALGFHKCISVVNDSKFGFICFVNTRIYEHVDSLDVWVVIGTRCFLFVLTFLAWIMLGIHSWFVVTNGTTFEIEKGDYLEYLKDIHICDLPFSSGLCTNLNLFCCVRDASSTWIRRVLSCSFWKRRDSVEEEWTPIIWKPVGTIVHDSEDWRNNLWSNKYWTCC